MTKSIKTKKPSEKKQKVPSYRKKILEKNAIENTQRYYNTSKFVPPVGNPYSWDVKGESVFDEVTTDLFGIGFDPEEDMTFLPEIPK
jgi:hypothetical protein